MTAERHEPDEGRWKACAVASWTPRVDISGQVRDDRAVGRFIARISDGYTAPAVEFGPPEALTVMGRHFAVITERQGLWPGSIHTIGRFKWHQAFALAGKVRLLHERAIPPLVAASSGYDNYYHWTAETLGALLAHSLSSPDAAVAAVVPEITRSWQREALDLFGPPHELIEVARDEAAVFDQAILTNVTARDFCLWPHPILADLFRACLPLAAMPPAFGKRLYIARLDAGNRRFMRNEEALCAMLTRHGFEIIVPSILSVKAQATAFAHATLIVAPHGAALANLFYSDARASVIELQQEGYLSPGYAKLSQARALDYSTIINPCDERGDYHHDSVWTADLDLIERCVIRKLDEIDAKPLP